MSFCLQRLLSPKLLIACALVFATWLVVPLSANIAGGGDTGPDVTLEAKGKQAILSNGIVTAIIETDSAEVSSLTFKGREMIHHDRSHSRIYFSRDGGEDYEMLPHCQFSVTTQSPDTIDVCCKHVYLPAKDKHAWDVEAHFVLRRGAHGLYIYTVNSHPANYPAVGVGEWRMVWPMPEKNGQWLLEKVCIDELRHWTLPSAADYAKMIPVRGAPKEVTEFTTGPWKGRFDCKYVYVGIYHDLGCWGYASDVNKLGGWFVFGSHEFFTNGPYKQDLTATLGSLNLVHFNMNHFGGTSVHIEKGERWEKVYGPFLIYFNDGENADACWQEAREQAKAEAAAWPYTWVNHPVYPTASVRGTVTGIINLHDPIKPGLNAGGAWVGLAKPEDGKEGGFQFQAEDYQFWVHADSSGKFTLKGVRPGDYTLYAIVDGVVGEFSKKNAHVDAGQNLDLGVLDYTVQHTGRIVWEIGIPNRRATEFNHGNNYFSPMLCWKDSLELPDPLEYYVGKSDPSRDWNYAQSFHRSAAGLTPHPWKIHFTLNAAPKADGVLIIALAGSHEAELDVKINSHWRDVITPKFQGGNLLLRESDHSRYEVIRIPVSKKQLQKGENVITLTQTRVRDQSCIMYDYLCLELPE